MTGSASLMTRLIGLLALAGIGFLGGSVARARWFDASTAPAPAAALEIDHTADLAIGRADAAVTVRIFGDYECPACGLLSYPRLAPAMILGAAGGAWAATRLPDAILRPVIGVVLVAWAIVLVVRPGRFLAHPPEPRTGDRTHRVCFGAPGRQAVLVQCGEGLVRLGVEEVELERRRAAVDDEDVHESRGRGVEEAKR